MKNLMRFFITFLFIFSGCNPKDKNPSPNIILILTDDLGWKDLACYGNEFIETPNIDNLARNGIKFVNAYAASPVCSPTRAAILTGKYPARLHLTDYIPGKQAAQGVKMWHKFLVPDFHQQLPHREITIAENLKEKGYKTASIGKWHLGDSSHYPTTQGFNINIAGTDKGMPATYYYPYCNDNFPDKCVPGLANTESSDEYLTDRITQEAISFMKDQNSPFFLYLSYFSVHFPIEGRKDLVAKYEKKFKDLNISEKYNPHYAAMVTALDQNVGKVIDHLRASNKIQNTLIIFASDNGGLQQQKNGYYPVTNNSPLREGKGFIYEGGIRVPTILSWESKIKNSTSEAIISSIDFFPTIMEAVNIDYSNIDGESLLPLLRDDTNFTRETIYWHYPHYHNGMPASAIRRDRYKLIEFLENNELELYDLESDISEQNNLADDMPDKAFALKNQLLQWRNEVGAQMPTLNPEYDGSTRN